MIVERTSDEVLTIRHTDIAAGWEQRYLLMADVHWDNPHCDRRLLTKHLDQAKVADAGVLVFGDWFCAMQGKFDPRRAKADIRPEHNGRNYLDLIVDDAAAYLAPYRDNLIAMMDGNHETAIRSHLETDLLERLCRQLDATHMGYSGFVRLMFAGGAGRRTSRHLYWHHGHGGGGPVTKGTIQTNRRAASAEADIYVSGHIHEAWTVENVVTTLLESGRVSLKTQTHIQLPTYKQEYSMSGGFHIERGRPAKPLGAYWLVFFYDNSQSGNVGYRVERAN